MKHIFTIFIFISLVSVAFHVSFGQQNTDTLKEKLSAAQNDKDKAVALEALLEKYLSAQDIDSFIKYGEIAVPLYAQVGKKELAAKTSLALSLIHVSKGDVKKGEQYMPENDDYFLAQKDYKRQARYDFNKATILSHQNNFNAAQEYYNKVLDSYNKGRDVESHLVFKTYENLFGGHVYTRQYSKALKTSANYTSFIEQHYPEHKGYAYYYLGSLYRFTSDYKKAHDQFLKSLRFYEDKNDALSVAASHMQLGINHLSLDQPDSSIDHLEKALTYYRSVDDQASIARVYNALSSSYFQKKDIKKAEEYIQKAIDLTDKGQDNYLYDNAFLWTIKLAKAMEDSALILSGQKSKTELQYVTGEMERNFQKILAKKEQMTPGVLSHNYRYLSKAHELLGNYEQALAYFKSEVQLKDSVHGIDQLRDFTDMEANIAHDKQNEILKLEEANKRMHLQKELELKALKYEFEKKQALAKTEEERLKLLQEEELKRKEIEIKYAEEQKAIALKFEQEKEIARIEQEKKDAIGAAELRSARNVRNLSAIGVGLACLLLGIATWSYLQKKKDNKRIASEKRKSDELLLNILPHEVAEELKEKGSTSAQLHEEVSVLFTDFVNFTANSEKIGVQELLNELNDYFTVFDQIMEQRGLEKIKTIGDAYLAVSGLPASDPQHAQNAILAAKDILKFVTERKANNKNGLDIRIGVHSGPVIAGIVGVKKFAYDIWGDTVNTAARMEQSSAPGKINVSASTFTLAKNDFSFESRGLVPTKGKGEMEMYFLN